MSSCDKNTHVKNNGNRIPFKLELILMHSEKYGIDFIMHGARSLLNVITYIFLS